MTDDAPTQAPEPAVHITQTEWEKLVRLDRCMLGDVRPTHIGPSGELIIKFGRGEHLVCDIKGGGRQQATAEIAGYQISVRDGLQVLRKAGTGAPLPITDITTVHQPL